MSDSDHRFLALGGQHREFDFALVYVINDVGGVALLEYILILLKFDDRPASPRFGEKG